MKEYFDLQIEEKWRKQEKISTFIAAIAKLTSLKEINLAIYQGSDLINVYKTFFDKNYVHWLKELLNILIEVTLYNASSFAQWYLRVTELGYT